MMIPAKLYKNKAPKKGKQKKKTKSKDQSWGRQNSPKEVSHKEVMEP
jgi:hypothetical protein